MVVDQLNGQTNNPCSYACTKASAQERMCGRVSMAGPCRGTEVGVSGTGLVQELAIGQTETDGSTHSDGTAKLDRRDS